MAGFHRGMGGKDALFHDFVRIPGGPFVPGVLDRPARAVEQFQGQQAGVPLIHVIFADGKSEGVENAGAAQAEDDFLLEAVVGVTAVKGIGQPPVLVDVAGDIGVEEQDRDFAPRGALDPVKPGLDLDVAPLDGDQGFGRQQFHQGLGLPFAGQFDLPAVGAELLVKVALAMGQGNRDHRQLEIRRALDSVACEHPETAAVGGDVVGETDLHGKIGDFRFTDESFPVTHRYPLWCNLKVCSIIAGNFFR
jgi:hypothetical protein